MGPASEINAHTGFHSSSFCGLPSGSSIDYRVQVRHSDLDPAVYPGAQYFVQGHYVTTDDAAPFNPQNNANNNASHRKITISYTPQTTPPTTNGDTYNATITSGTRQQEPAIYAWKDVHPDVVITPAQVAGEGLFIVGARATDLQNGFWHYEYAVMNLNSDRSGGSFSVPLPDHVVIPPESIGFHDVNYHSGEIYNSADWTPTVTTEEIRWETVPYSSNVLANALRWSMMYNFRFNANVAPDATNVVLGLFKPGFPDQVTITTIGPTLAFIDCNQNNRPDHCDIDCGGLFCEAPCGESNDCNSNLIPDDCEQDCNENGLADPCDLPPLGTGEDCNGNTVPDECEEDCDEDGTPDDCELTLDTDGDGLVDCEDLCPETTPPGGCDLNPLVICRLNTGFCLYDYPRAQCRSLGGTPVCGDFSMLCHEMPPCPTSACREGCLIGDYDGDGDFDLYDVEGCMNCYSGASDAGGYIAPSAECSRLFDFDGDADVDFTDVEEVRVRLTGPE